MPGCMGTAALANGPRDKSHCTCIAGDSAIDGLSSDVRSLLKRVQEIEKLMGSI